MPISRRRFLPLVLLASLLSGCAAPLLLLPSQRDLMWALLTPLVGFNPNEVNLFEQPIIKQRMTALLGTHYEDTMQLLRTADQLQREGPLFFVVSRVAQNPAVARQAGLVWNADTDRFAAILRHEGRSELLTEMVQGAVASTVANQAPQLPTAIAQWMGDVPATPPAAAALPEPGPAPVTPTPTPIPLPPVEAVPDSGAIPPPGAPELAPAGSGDHTGPDAQVAPATAPAPQAPAALPEVPAAPAAPQPAPQAPQPAEPSAIPQPGDASPEPAGQAAPIDEAGQAPPAVEPPAPENTATPPA